MFSYLLIAIWGSEINRERLLKATSYNEPKLNNWDELIDFIQDSDWCYRVKTQKATYEDEIEQGRTIIPLSFFQKYQQ